MRKLLFLALALPISNALPAYKDYHKCTISNYYVYDGDTIYADINCDNIMGKQSFFKKNNRLRFARIDTAEIRTQDPCEKRMSVLAKNYVNDNIKAAKKLDIEVVGEEYYGGLLVEVFVDGINLSSALLRENLAVIYKNKKKHHTNWCDIEKIN
jgi:endonuclease YncB( thermonuclease family)